MDLLIITLKVSINFAIITNFTNQKYWIEFSPITVIHKLSYQITIMFQITCRTKTFYITNARNLSLLTGLTIIIIQIIYSTTIYVHVYRITIDAIEIHSPIFFINDMYSF